MTPTDLVLPRGWGDAEGHGRRVGGAAGEGDGRTGGGRRPREGLVVAEDVDRGAVGWRYVELHDVAGRRALDDREQGVGLGGEADVVALAGLALVAGPRPGAEDRVAVGAEPPAEGEEPLGLGEEIGRAHV